MQLGHFVFPKVPFKSLYGRNFPAEQMGRQTLIDISCWLPN